MIVRDPCAIGRFYPQNADQLAEVVPHYLKAGTKPKIQPWAFLLPHAGYVFCGDVIGKTLGGGEIFDTVVVLCPNHTGRGKAFSVWPSGVWKMPMGNFPIDEDLVQKLSAPFEQDCLAHLNEHAIEVLLPFLYYAHKGRVMRIVPICVGTQHPMALQMAGQALGKVLRDEQKQGKNISVVISSDMNHYEEHSRTLEKDALAFERIQANDPQGLLAVCQQEEITMCGVAPCALCLYMAQSMGMLTAEIVAHTTSGPSSGNFRQTVGYAGIRFYFAA
ncbi:MAG: AmmeMemoRadiSam system protein B [Desulfovibrio sp.]|nr:AmmeMemoRadiSam system protein B [Desulfovibrio sp.]